MYLRNVAITGLITALIVTRVRPVCPSHSARPVNVIDYALYEPVAEIHPDMTVLIKNHGNKWIFVSRDP